MSFAKIAEARAVKKIVMLLKAESKNRSEPGVSEDQDFYASVILDQLIERIEAGLWKDIELPKPKPKKKKKP